MIAFAGPVVAGGPVAWQLAVLRVVAVEQASAVVADAESFELVGWPCASAACFGAYQCPSSVQYELGSVLAHYVACS